MHDNTVGPDALVEMLQVGSLCVDQVKKPVLDSSLPSNPVTGVLLKLPVYRLNAELGLCMSPAMEQHSS